MDAAASFVARYSAADRATIDFLWNGKHADQFVDANQRVRWDVISHCINEPGSPSPLLLEHLFLADAAWTREAWGAPQHFAELASLLLERGGEAVIETFARGFNISFDTFGACHAMRLSRVLATRLAVVAREKAAVATEQRSRTCLEATAELLSKLQQGTASVDWATIPPGTSVKAVRAVWPRWYHKLWGKVSAWARRAR